MSEDKYKIGGYSFTVPSLDKVNYLIGPVSYVKLYSSEYDKTIHLLGDIHTYAVACPRGYNEKNTIHINDFLKAKFKEKDQEGNPIQYDFFIEIDYKKKEDVKEYQGIKAFLKYIGYYGSDFDFIAQIYYKFYKCFQIEKQYCNYQNVRFTYADLRSGDEFITLTEFWHFLNDFYLEDDKYLNQKQNTLNQLKRYPIKKIKEILGQPELYLSKYKVNKQLENVFDKDIKKYLLELKQYFIDSSIDLYKQLDKIYSLMSSFKKLSRKDLNYLEKIWEKMGEFHALLMDLYIISRIFRRFSDDSQTSKNIIIYSGDFHTSQYEKFFKDLGFKVISKAVRSETENKNFQCINVTSFKNL